MSITINRVDLVLSQGFEQIVIYNLCDFGPYCSQQMLSNKAQSTSSIIENTTITTLVGRRVIFTDLNDKQSSLNDQLGTVTASAANNEW